MNTLLALFNPRLIKELLGSVYDCKANRRHLKKMILLWHMMLSLFHTKLNNLSSAFLKFFNCLKTVISRNRSSNCYHVGTTETYLSFPKFSNISFNAIAISFSLPHPLTSLANKALLSAPFKGYKRETSESCKKKRTTELEGLNSPYHQNKNKQK